MALTLEQIDPNMLVKKNIPDDVEWWDGLDSEHFSLHGLIVEDGKLMRMPSKIAEKVSIKVAHLNNHTSGGRLSFITDSPYVALHCKINGHVMANMSWSGSGSFDLYADGKFAGLFRSIPKGEQTEVLYNCPLRPHQFDAGEHHMMMSFPLYAGVEELSIGLKKGCTLRAYDPYKDTLPILYYGSSITQGASASRPAMLYQSYISKDTNVDFINLGFSGSAKGEPAIADYLAGIRCSIFVCDWDHNLNTADRLRERHYPLYRTFRDAQPDTPIIFISRPDFDTMPCAPGNREVIIESYERALAEGDKNVYFIDGETIFGEDHRTECTVDHAHPTDLGFFRFYQALLPLIQRLLK